MSRWIYSFESVGARVLSAGELEKVSNRLNAVRVRTVLRALLSIAIGLGILLGIVLATDSLKLGAVVTIGSLVAFFYSLNLANNDHATWLLFSRAKRLGKVETFRLSEVPTEVRSLYAIEALTVSESAEPFWKVEEELISQLRRSVGADPTTLETLDGEGGILIVNNSFVRRAVTVKVADLENRSVSDCPVETASATRCSREAARADY